MVILEGILNDVEIKDFRAITNLRIPLTKINVFVGRNNTGKTTIIEALAMLLSSFNEYKDFVGGNILNLIIQYRGEPRYLIRMNRPYAMISATLNTGDKITLYILKDLEKFKEVDLTVANKIEQALDQIADSMYQKEINEIEQKIERLKDLIKRYPKDSPRARSLEKEINEYQRKLDTYYENKDDILFSLKSNLRGEIMLYTANLVNNTVSNVYLLFKKRRYFVLIEDREVRIEKVKFTDIELKPIYARMYKEKNLIEKLDDLPIDRVIELVERLRTLIPYFYDYRKGMVIFKFDERKEIVPINVVGDGLLALLELFTPSIYGVKINLIEEPELHMHPGFLEKYAQELVKFSKKHDIQYIMTTHSLEFLEYLLYNARQQGLLNDISIIRLYRLPDGEIDYEVLSGEEAYDELEDIKGDLRGP